MATRLSGRSTAQDKLDELYGEMTGTPEEIKKQKREFWKNQKREPRSSSQTVTPPNRSYNSLFAR